MLEGIEALATLDKFGTVTEAATRLRLTQSAVSKRIQSLESELGFPLTQAEGRRVRLTPEARAFLDRAQPLMSELLDLKKVPQGSGTSFWSTPLDLALADSIASSWGPQVLRDCLGELGGSTRELPLPRLHAHRSVLLVESIRMGRYHLGLCTDGGLGDLFSFPVCSEAFVLLQSPVKGSGKSTKKLPLICIEAGSASWRFLEKPLSTHPELGKHDRLPVESFMAIVQMVKAGFGIGLVPLGLAKSLRLNPLSYKRVSGMQRDLVLVTRKTLCQREGFREFHFALARAAKVFLG